MTQANQTPPLKILTVIARLNIGGPAVQVVLTTERMNRAGHNATLVCGAIGASEGDMSYYASAHNVTPIVIDDFGPAPHLWRDLKAVWKLYRLMRRLRPDLVHTHTAKAGFLGRVAARLAGVPRVVHTFHGHVFRGYFGRVKTWLYLILERLVAVKTDRIITLTPSLRTELAENYRIAPPQKISVVPLGLELDRLRDQPRGSDRFRRQWDLPAEGPLIGIVGRLAPVKNHHLFITASRLISERIANARFVVVGDGETRREIEISVANAGLSEVYTFTGWQNDLTAIYSALSVLVISSRNEGTPATIIEALAGGCPVVSTDVGGVRDLLADGSLGRLVPPDDAQMLAAEIITCLKNDVISEETRRQTADRFGVDAMVVKLTDLYRELLLL